MELVVSRQPLTLTDGRLTLGTEQTEHVTRQIDGRGFVDDAQPGDWVSLHWSWVREVLSPRQQTNLAHFTDDHVKLANQTL
jgi:hypothetical protein